jgi:hypothetical protein
MDLKLEVCDVRACEAMCCHDGVYLSPEEEATLHRLVERTPSLRARLPSEYVVEGSWQGEKLGRKTATRPHAYRNPDYPAHFPRTRCVFADAQGWCELEKLGRARGRHRWHYKPFTCWMFPMDDVDGEAVPPSADAADDPYRVPDYPGYVSVVPCGRHEPSGRPWRQALVQELRFHVHGRLFED